MATVRPVEFSFAGFTWPRNIAELPKGTPAKRLASGTPKWETPYYHAPKPLTREKQGIGFYLGSMGQPHLRWSWCDAVEGVGRSISHSGWNTDSDGAGDTIRGLVMRLPASRGFLAGWSMGAGMIASVEYEVYADEVSAAQAADEMARIAAERECEAQEEQRETDAAEQATADQVYSDAARSLYASDELEFDDSPKVSHGDGGAFVAAWVWVSDSAAGIE